MRDAGRSYGEGVTLHQLDLGWLGSVSLPVPLIVFLWGLIEGLAVPLPMPGGVVLGGLAAAMRPTLADIALLSVYGTVGYCLGASVGYWLGLKARESERIRRLLAKIGLGPERLQAVDRMFARHGQWAVMWTRPIWIGNYISLPAGLARMPYGRFLVLTLVGIFPTSFVFLWSGEELAALTERYGTVVVWLTLAIGAAVLLGHLLWNRRKARQESGEAGISPPADGTKFLRVPSDE